MNDAVQDDPTPAPTAEQIEAGQVPVDDTKKVRLVPADWTVDSVSFTTGSAPDELEHVITASKPGNVPYLVGEDEAEDVITAAAQRGLAVTKEQSA